MSKQKIDIDDDKPTVVLDMDSLRNQNLRQEEELAINASELEFNIVHEPPRASQKEGQSKRTKDAPAPQMSPSYKIILFDFQSDFFKKSLKQLPTGHDYKIVTNLAELNQYLKSKNFQIVVFNYDVNPKAVNQLCLQIKQKLPHTKTMIIAKSISPEKARAHAKTSSGAHGYYQIPLDSDRLEKEFQKIYQAEKAA